MDSDDTEHAAAKTLTSLSSTVRPKNSNTRPGAIDMTANQNAVQQWAQSTAEINHQSQVVQPILQDKTNTRISQQQLTALKPQPQQEPKVSLCDFLASHHALMTEYFSSDMILTYEQMKLQEGWFDFIHASRQSIQAYTHMLWMHSVDAFKIQENIKYYLLANFEKVLHPTDSPKQVIALSAYVLNQYLNVLRCLHDFAFIYWTCSCKMIALLLICLLYIVLVIYWCLHNKMFPFYVICWLVTFLKLLLALLIKQIGVTTCNLKEISLTFSILLHANCN